MSEKRPWSDAELARLHSLDSDGISADRIARELGRDEADIDEQLKLVRMREGPVPSGGPRDEQWYGPDEEGDVPPVTDAQADPSAAWVHSGPGENRG